MSNWGFQLAENVLLSYTIRMLNTEEKNLTRSQLAARKRMKKLPKKILSEKMRALALAKNKSMSKSERRRHAVMMGKASVKARKLKPIS